MILVPMQNHTTVSVKFRKAPYFALIQNDSIKIIKNEGRRLKGSQFLDYLQTFQADSILVANIGPKTAKRLIEHGYRLYMTHHPHIDKLRHIPLTPITLQTLFLATLGHR